jgi:hypothetical protein
VSEQVGNGYNLFFVTQEQNEIVVAVVVSPLQLAGAQEIGSIEVTFTGALS